MKDSREIAPYLEDVPRINLFIVGKPEEHPNFELPLQLGTRVYRADQPTIIGTAVKYCQDSTLITVLWPFKVASGFTSFAMPLIRKTFGGLIAQEIFKIQPMTAPAGGIFYKDFTYGSGSNGKP